MTHLDEKALLPCPFCGKEPIVTRTVEDDNFDRWFHVRCEECAIEIGDEYRSDAINTWNRRASPALPSSPVSELVEEWRTAMEGVTPGPWTLIPAREYDGDDDDLIGSYTSPASIEGGDGNPVCTFGSEDGSGTLFENEANHRYVQRCSPDRIDALLTTLSTRNAELEREVKRLREALERIDGLEVMEINPSNYDHDDVCELNRNASQASVIARDALSALEATPPAPKVTEAMVKAGRAHYSEGGCMGLDEHEVLEVVEAIIHAVLTSSGFRILGPDEIDGPTVEKCAEVAARLKTNTGVYPHRDEAATAIRALKEKRT